MEIEVGGRTVRVTNPDRVYFPTRGETKLDLVNYYLSVGGSGSNRTVTVTPAANAVADCRKPLRVFDIGYSLSCVQTRPARHRPPSPHSRSPASSCRRSIHWKKSR